MLFVHVGALNVQLIEQSAASLDNVFVSLLELIRI